MGKHAKIENFVCYGRKLYATLSSISTVIKRKKEKLALFMKRIINFQQMIRCKAVPLRKDWRIITILLVSGLQEDGQAREEGVSIKRCSTSKEFKRRSSVGS